MAFKAFSLLVLAAFVFQGQSLTLVDLPDHSLTHTPNPFFGSSMAIGKSFLDTLQLCLVTFPSGATYEAYPENNVPSPFHFAYSAQPFTTCAIGFFEIGVEYSGTYRLSSLVLHSSNNSETFTFRNFHLTVLEPWTPYK